MALADISPYRCRFLTKIHRPAQMTKPVYGFPAEERGIHINMENHSSLFRTHVCTSLLLIIKHMFEKSSGNFCRADTEFFFFA